MLLEELLVAIGFDVDTDGIEEAQGKLDKFKGFVTKIGAVVAAGTAAISAMSYATAGMATDLTRTANGISITTEELQKLIHAGSRVGITADQISGSLESLNDNVYGTFEGNQDAISMFSRLGVELRNVNGTLKSTDQIFMDVTDAFNKFPDGPVKAAMANKMFGASGRDMLLMVKQGSTEIKRAGKEFKEWGGVLSEDAIKNSLAFKHSLSEMWSLLKIVYTLIAQQLLPVVTGVIKSFKEWLIINKEFLKSKISGFFEVLIHLIAEVWSWLSKALSVLGFFIKIVDMATSSLGGLSKILKTVITLVGLGLVGALTAAGFSIAHSIILFIKFNGGIKSSIILLKALGTTALKTWVKAFAPLALIVAKFIAIGAAVTGLILLFQDLWTWVTNPNADTFFKDWFGSFEEFKSKSWEKIKGWGESIADFFSTIWIVPELMGELGDAWEKTAKPIFKKTFDSIGDWFKNSILGGMSALFNWVSGKIQAAKETIREVITNPIGTAKKIGNKAVSAGKKIVNFGREKLASGLNYFREKLGGSTTTNNNSDNTNNVNNVKNITSKMARSVKNNNTTSSTRVENKFEVNVKTQTGAPSGKIAQDIVGTIKKEFSKEFFNAQVSNQTALEY